MKTLKNRLEILEKIGHKQNSKTILYITGDKPGFETQIGADVLPYFVSTLNAIGVCNKISLILYTRGGNTLSAWNIINLIKMYCDELEVIIPYHAHSSGTLIAIGANKIIMTKQATLGPIDPSIITTIMINNNPQNISISVEEITGYFDLARKELGLKQEESLTPAFLKIADKIDPLLLGKAYRTRSQIRMLAEKLLISNVPDEAKRKRIINFLCSDSGSHDYTINRREAKTELGLQVEKPDEVLYNLIESLYNSFSSDMELNIPHIPTMVLHNSKYGSGNYIIKRCLLESTYTESYSYVNIGKYSQDNESINHSIFYEGWLPYEQAVKFFNDSDDQPEQ